MRFLYLVLTSLTLGVLVGRFLSPNFGNAYEVMLYVLIFLIGMDLGLSFRKEELMKVGRKALLLPFLTLIGSILGGLIASLLLGIEPKWGLAIGAGCGWYSLTGPLIAQYSPLYGAVGFLGNLMREILTILIYPIATKRIDPKKAVAMGGATTMDTTLPIITKFGGREVALVAFVHGFVLTALVPFLLPLILTL
ncbi:lysine exporter LysO family protein [Thermococcus sp.]|uniref:lysine exporter LysO family protein n=1 Tax=Thermococcus sp. TaxID=35749 RepID=UPI00263848EF|nr:lysine exporter LysO family protein [Thermococcus sp.]